MTADSNGFAESTTAVPTVAFDVIGTLFGLDRPRSVLLGLGAPDFALELWFAQTLRDAFAWSHAGAYRPLREFFGAALPRTLAEVGVEADDAGMGEVLSSLAELDPLPGAVQAVTSLSDAGWRVMALTNGGEEFTRGLLERAGILDRFALTLSCDRIEKTKPHPEVYEMARKEARGELWLVAAHAWDVAGAARAGLRTIWIRSGEKVYLSTFPEPDLVVDKLTEAAEGLIRLAGPRG